MPPMKPAIVTASILIYFPFSDYSDIRSWQGVLNDVDIHSTGIMFESASSHISYVKSKVASDNLHCLEM